MAWSASKIFTAFILDQMNQTASNISDMDANTFKAALFLDSITPSQTVANTATGYNRGIYLSGVEVTATGWPAGGPALTGVTSSFTSNVYKFTASPTSGGSTDTISNAVGVLVYNSSLTTNLNGVCYNWFGGPASVTSGTFTVVWNNNGIFSLTL
jgi:hypothetical protein